MIILFFLVCSVSTVLAMTETESFISLAGKVDWSCMDLKAEGPCMVGPDPGIFIKYWEPALVMETVKRPGDYVVQEMGPIIGPLARNVASGRMKSFTGLHNVEVTSTNSYHSATGSNLQFNEVHLYDFPLKLFYSAVLCPSVPNATLGIRYLSEIDSVQWRTESTRPFYRIGNWGTLYPRTGFLIQTNPGVSSAVAALRGVSAASDLLTSLHIVESPLDFQVNPFMDKMQLIYPGKGMCMMPGTDLRLWEPQSASASGKYVWLYWRFRQCCRAIVAL